MPDKDKDGAPTQQTNLDHPGQSSNRNANAFSCSEHNAEFNRLAHMRRHELTHGGEKPYSCSYCPVASSRKEVIVRHIRNFHPDHANRNIRACRGRRRNNSHTGTIRPLSRSIVSKRTSPATTTALGDTGHHSEGADDVTSEQNGSPASNRVDGTPGSHESSLDNFMSSHKDLFAACFPGSPLPFNGSFMEPQIGCPNLPDLVDLDVLLADTQEFLREMPRQNPALTMELPLADFPSSGQPLRYAVEHTAACNVADDDDDDCARAWARQAKYPTHLLESIRLSSKYAVRRFVKAFFEHFATHIPIIHHPTFDIATAPSPLLLAIMACGAIYVGQNSTARSMFNTALQLLENDRRSTFEQGDFETWIWKLQTSLLLSYFEVHSGTAENRSMAFAHSINLLKEAIEQPNMHSALTYRDWVLRESMNRCRASSILIGASMCLKERKEWLVSPIVEARFALPSSSADWLKDEASWKLPTPPLYGEEALNSVFAGRAPFIPPSEFGLVTLVAAVLYRVCSFEILTSSHHSELYAEFGDKMGRSVHVIEEMFKVRSSQTSSRQAPDPSLQMARSMLNSVHYHLHASGPLRVMKELLWSPAVLDGARILYLQGWALSPYLHKALLCAANQLRIDCRLGLAHIKKIAPLHFGPECIVGSYEGGLLLTWYLQFKQLTNLPGETPNTISALINDSFAEADELRSELHDRLSAVPLIIVAELISDNSVWKWPSLLAQRLRFLVKKFKDAGDTIRVATNNRPSN